MHLICGFVSKRWCLQKYASKKNCLLKICVFPIEKISLFPFKTHEKIKKFDCSQFSIQPLWNWYLESNKSYWLLIDRKKDKINFSQFLPVEKLRKNKKISLSPILTQKLRKLFGCTLNVLQDMHHQGNACWKKRDLENNFWIFR